MTGLDDFFKGNVLAGLAVGVGAVILAPVVLPVLVAVSRPVAKSAIKTGVILFDKGREAAAEMTEVFEDMVAEARAELEQPYTGEPGGALAADGNGEMSSDSTSGSGTNRKGQHES